MTKRLVPVLCDVDGVLANFTQGAIVAHRVAGTVLGDMCPEEITDWKFHESAGLTEEEFWGPIAADENFWFRLDPYVWASDLLYRIRGAVAATGGEALIVFATSPSRETSCPSDKVDWLRKHGFLPKDSISYAIGPYKYMMSQPGSILIDDSSRNVERFVGDGTKGSGIVFPQRYNRNAKHADDPVPFVIDQLQEWLDGLEG